MKKTILLPLIALLITFSSFSKGNLTETQKLATTCKIWGFLKYYHPNVANGEFDWDEQLFEVLPKVKKSTNHIEFSNVLSSWIKSLGTVEACKKCDKESKYEHFDKNFDLSWLDDSTVFSTSLSNELRFIETNRHQGDKYYISSPHKIGQILISNEKPYKDFDWTDENMRLLILFRYWNLIEYFFPYKYQMDKNWDNVLNDMIPKFASTKTEIDLHLIILELAMSIDDSHASYNSVPITNHFRNKFIPVHVEFIEGKAIVTEIVNDSLANLSEIQIGDIIVSIEGINISQVFENRLKYISGSNLNRKKTMLYSLFNGNTDSLHIEYLRGDKIYSKKIKRYSYSEIMKGRNVTSITSPQLLDSNIGYVKMEELSIEGVSGMIDSFSSTKAIIFDFRFKPRNNIYKVIINYISSSENTFLKTIYSDPNYPGRFIWGTQNKCGENGKLMYKGKIILLVDSHTQSHSEYSVMSLQTGDNVTTIGSQTSGADGNVLRFDMIGGNQTRFTGLGIFYPDGTETQRKGVKIDIVVEQTIESFMAGKDNVLETAIEFINN